MIDLFTDITEIANKDGNKVYDIFFGPNHPGMHGNFGYVVDMIGHSIAKARVNAGLLHRGFEKIMETNLWHQNLSLIPRICVVDPDPNEVAYCGAIEKIMGLEIPERAKFIRTITLEMSRMTSHLMGMGSVGGATGLYTVMYLMLADRDRLLDMFEWLTGGRIYHIYNIPGGVRRDLPKGWKDKLYGLMDFFESKLKEYDEILYRHPIIHKRLKGVGVITAEQAKKWGITGPNLRATGVKFDTRKAYPYAAYDQLEFDIPTEKEGDALARANLVRAEFEVTISIIRQALDKLPEGDVNIKLGNPLKFKVPEGEAYAKVESSKGEYGYYIVSTGGIKPYRVSVRGPSLPAGLFLCHKHLPGMRIDDVALWMNTLQICAPDFDR